MQTKVKIVLDADVIIHFTKGGILHLLPDFLPDYEFIVLDIVRNEIPQILLSTLDNQIKRIGNIKLLKFGSTGCEIREFARLTSSSGPALGRGESACMVYCRYHNDVVGSSNIKDVTDYCNEYGITFLTTTDFLFYGIKNGLMSIESATEFIKKVRELGSYPPIVDFSTYVCNKL